MLVNPAEFKKGMRAVSAAVTIVTSQCDGVRVGFTATAMCSLCADPPLLLVCVNRESASHDVISRSKRMIVNVMSIEDVDLARRFAGSERDSRFAAGAWKQGRLGGYILESALVVFDCQVQSEIQAGSHSIFTGLVEDMRIREDGSPLLYSAGAFAALGPTVA
jgi:flavin reductase